MKKLLKILFLLVLIATIGFIAFRMEKIKAYVNRWATFSFCDNTVYYKIGDVDPKFNISKKQITENARQAADIWHKIMGREIFMYDSTGDLVINMVYDDRQKSLDEVSSQQEGIDGKKEEHSSSIEEFEIKKVEVENKLNELNNEIKKWNEKGGAPRGVYDELMNKQKSLQQEIDRLNNFAQRLNKTTDQINTNISDLNQSVNNFNKLLKVKPEEGIYYGGSNRIDIFIYNDEKGLIFTLAHEMGHALGLDHVEAENSIMNPTSSLQTEISEDDINAIQAFCAEQDKLELIKNDIKNYYYSVVVNFLET